MKLGNIRLRDIDKTESFNPVSDPPPVGCILLGEDGWHARCSQHEQGGHGTGDLDELDPDVIWMVTSLADDHRFKVMEVESRERGITLLRETWLRQDFGTMTRDWGMSDLPGGQKADVLASLLDRTARTALNALAAGGDAPKADGLRKAPSLSTWMRGQMRPELARTSCSEPGLGAALRDVIKARGFKRQASTPDGAFMMEARFPPLSHACEILQAPVPAADKWKVAIIEGKAHINGLLPDLEATEVPVVIVGTPEQGSGVGAYVQSWTRGTAREKQRCCYTLDEVREMVPGLLLRNWKAYLGEGWEDSASSICLRRLIQNVGEEIAHASWSAGLAAENLLCAAMRQPGANERVPFESAWIAARNRVRMAPVVKAVEDAGGEVMATYVGDLSIASEPDPEAVDRLARTLWSNGMFLAVDTAMRIADMGVDIPLAAEDWGGAEIDLPMARIRGRRQRNAMWNLDSLIDLEPAERTERLGQMAGGQA
ncbi:MAG: hypothetical protein F4213_05570 [Boseongicola sp. SB0677_bin_26]|nr:hypothetical protein [Boseongicola sp. SB0665_bin_10]MYG25475.1 hypothetical protein [Boseongicola sp. SB0677_bin_26]